MQFVRRTRWLVGEIDDPYWIRDAMLLTCQELGDTDTDNLHFETRELAEEFAFLVLRRFHAEGNCGVEVRRATHLSRADLAAAREAVCGAPNPWTELRAVGEPQLGFDPKHRTPTLTQTVELRLCGTLRATRSVTVNGEVYSKTTEENVYSSWYPVPPVETTLNVYSVDFTEVHPDPKGPTTG
jgi:hypothetical protein